MEFKMYIITESSVLYVLNMLNIFWDIHYFLNIKVFLMLAGTAACPSLWDRYTISDTLQSGLSNQVQALEIFRNGLGCAGLLYFLCCCDSLWAGLAVTLLTPLCLMVSIFVFPPSVRERKEKLLGSLSSIKIVEAMMDPV